MPDTAIPKIMKVRDLPLRQRTILVTRARPQIGGLKSALENLGAKVLDFPVIRIVPPKTWAPVDRALRGLDGFDWIVFTSVNGVSFFMKRLRKAEKFRAVMKKKKIAAIGAATADCLEKNGFQVDLKPRKFTSEALFKELKSRHEIKGRSYLLPRADIAPDILPESLRKAGAEAVQIAAYRTVPTRPLRRVKEIQKMLLAGRIDFVLFASASTVRNFFNYFPKTAGRRMETKFISIGPVTTRMLRKLGYKPYREAKVHTIDGLIRALLSGR